MTFCVQLAFYIYRMKYLTIPLAVLIEKLTVLDVSRNIAHFMDSESSLPIHERLPLVPLMSQVTPVHALNQFL